jgi:hypothetical protein
MAVWSTVKLSALAAGLRLDAEYYQPLYLSDTKRLNRLPSVQLKALGFVTDGIHSGPEVAEVGGVPYVAAKSVTDHGLAMGDVLRITDRQHAANARTSLEVHDVLVTTTGTIGWAAVVRQEDLPANIDRDVGLVRLIAPSSIDPYFLVTFLNCEYGRFQTSREATGNVQQHLFIDKLRELRIPLLQCADEVSRQTRAAYDKRRKSAACIEAAETRLTEALGLGHLDLTSQKTYIRHFRDLRAGNRFGAEYYMPCKQRVLDALAKLPHRTIAGHAPAIREMWDPTRASKAEVVRNFDVTNALEPFLDDDAEPQRAADIGSAKKRFQTGDVVISRLRSYLKEIAIVRTSEALPAVGSSEFIVLRPTGHGLSAETLMVFLRCPLVQTILRWSQDGSNHPRFAEEDLLTIPVPEAVPRVQKKIDALVREAMDARRQAARLLEQAKKTVEDMITSDSEKGT